MRIWSLAALIVLGPALAACQAQPAAGSPPDTPAAIADTATAPTAATGAPMPLIVERFERDMRDVGRFYDAPWSEARRQRLESLYTEWHAKLGEIDFSALDLDGRLDWLLLDNHLQARRNELALEQRRLGGMEDLLPFREAITGLEVERWRIEPVDPRQMAEAVDAIARQAEEVKKRVKKGAAPASAESADDHSEAVTDTQPAEAAAPAPSSVNGAPTSADLHVEPAVALRAAGATGALRRTLETTIGAYIDHKPGFAWWLDAPRDKALGALRDYENHLRRDIAGIKGEDDDPLVGDPIGREALLADLATEMIVYTPEELIAIAERELAWRQAEMRRAAREMGFGDDWRAALDVVKGRAVDPGEQDLYVAEVSREVIAFLKEHDLVTIPPLCEELWRAEMIPGSRQAMFPFAYYGGLHVGVAYPTDDMSHEDKLASMRGNNRHFTRNVVPHELIPGHHLQSFMAARHNPHRRLFSTPFLVEGWALYWEMTLWDAGWAQGPEDRIGILFWGMHRCARIIVSLKYHLGEMTAEEMIDFLVDEIGHERFGATSEVRRYIGDSYSPLYQVAYMIGGLQFRALRREVVDGGLMTEREFHDAILTCGPIPVELIRARLLGEDLMRDWAPSWRWDGDGMMNDER